MEDMKRWQIPSFGNWGDFCEELPITQYFETARQAGLIRCPFSGEEDLFKVPAVAEPPLVHYRKPKKSVEKQQKHHHHRHHHHHCHQQSEEQQRKQGRVCDAGQPLRRSRAPKAVDEDLYKIPPELLHQKPKRRGGNWRDFISRCLGLNCIP